jgi:serine/threonine protein kinase
MYGSVEEVCREGNCSYVLKVIKESENSASFNSLEREMLAADLTNSLVDEKYEIGFTRSGAVLYKNRNQRLSLFTAAAGIPSEQIAPYVFDKWTCRDNKTGMRVGYIIMQRFGTTIAKLYGKKFDEYAENVDYSDNHEEMANEFIFPFLDRCLRNIRVLNEKLQIVHGDIHSQQFLVNEDTGDVVLADYGAAGSFFIDGFPLPAAYRNEEGLSDELKRAITLASDLSVFDKQITDFAIITETSHPDWHEKAFQLPSEVRKNYEYVKLAWQTRNDVRDTKKKFRGKSADSESDIQMFGRVLSMYRRYLRDEINDLPVDINTLVKLIKTQPKQYRPNYYRNSPLGV